MLSVCIPTYRFFVLAYLPQADRQVLTEDFSSTPVFGQLQNLYAQLKSSGIEFELLVYEDASPEPYPSQNKRVTELGPEVEYRLLDSNLGRAAIRNLLAREAKFPNLLFLDADSGFLDGFVAGYLPYIDSELKKVVSGGRVYPAKERLAPQFWLHQRYGQDREKLDVNASGDKCYMGFQTNNFLVPRSLMLRHPFEESHAGYGHEDTLWGWQLRDLGVAVERIDNPVIHLDLMPAEVLVQKQLEAVDNLKKLEAIYPNLPTRLGGFALRWRWAKWLLIPVLSVIEPIARRRLLKDRDASIYWLDLLKLRRYWK
ncbi:MAG: glycosyltransferase [Bacteroidota bacterium]